MVNTQEFYHDSFNYKVGAPKSFTKTKRDYTWYLPASIDDAIKRLTVPLVDLSSFKDYSTLYNALDYWFERRRRDAKVPEKPPKGKKKVYNMRSVRCYHATKYVELKTEFEVMRWKCIPPNPL